MFFVGFVEAMWLFLFQKLFVRQRNGKRSTQCFKVGNRFIKLTIFDLQLNFTHKFKLVAAFDHGAKHIS